METKSESAFKKILIGVSIAVISALIITQFGLDKKDVKITENTPQVYTGLEKDNSKGKTNTPSKEVVKELEPEIEEKPVFLPNNTNNSIISGIFLDQHGEGLEGVQVWCSNCIKKDNVTTRNDGSFDLEIEYHLEDKSIQSIKNIKVCYQYKSQNDCILEHYKYLNFKFPKLKR